MDNRSPYLATVKRVVRFGRSQVRNFGKMAQRQPLTLHPLGSTTLDEDDVLIARQWLRKRSDWTGTQLTAQYEGAFARWNGSRHAFAFMSGRESLSACIYALDLKAGDEVLVPAYTCVVVPNAFAYAGVNPVYCDIELDTYSLDAEEVERRITPKVRAILLQHLYGLVSRDYEKIIGVARRHNLAVIEDCAHATGAEHLGVRVGNLGDIAFYSSEQSKIFNTVVGGLATTNDGSLAMRLAEYRDGSSLPDERWIGVQLRNTILNYYRFKHPQRWWRYELAQVTLGIDPFISTTSEEECGIKPSYYRRSMADPIAALGLCQLKKIDSYNERRRETAQMWDRWCDERGYRKPLVAPGSIPVFLRYPVLVEPEKKRDRSWAVRELGVELGVWFISKTHPASRDIGSYPNADRAVAQCINFPGVLV